MKHLTYILLSAVLISCWSNPRPNNLNNTISLDDALLEQSATRVDLEALVLDSLSDSWGWSHETLSGGVLLEKINANEGAFNTSGDTIVLDVEVSLVNGNNCFKEDSLFMIIDQSNVSQMFNIIAKRMHSGDSCRALVPSDLGYGVRGIPGVVPPGAMLLVDVKQLAY